MSMVRLTFEVFVTLYTIWQLGNRLSQEGWIEPVPHELVFVCCLVLGGILILHARRPSKQPSV